MSTKPPASPPPPSSSSLGAPGRTLWEGVLSLRQLPPHELVVLEQAAIALDRAAQARADIEANGLTIRGRFGAKSNPAVAVERNSQLIASRLIRQLGLPGWWSARGEAPR